MLNISIVDDEMSCIEEISNVVSVFLECKKVPFQFFKFQSGEDFLKSTISMDLVFLDIQMNGIDGISAAHTLREKNKHVALIYVTNFSSEIKRSFSVHPFAFIEKPINHAELIQNLQDFLNFSSPSVAKNNITVKSDKRELLVCVQDILYLEYKENRKINLVMQQETIEINGSIRGLLQLLSSYNFISPHKSFIINAAQIDHVKVSDIIMKNKALIPISQKKHSMIMKEISFYLHHQIKGA